MRRRRRISLRRGGAARARLGDDAIHAAVEALRELGKILGTIGEIALHHDHRIAPRIARGLGRGARERVERGSVALARLVPQHRERKHLFVPAQRLRGAIGAAIIERDDLVLARMRLEHRSDAPEEQPDRGRFVERGNADVQHDDE